MNGSPLGKLTSNIHAKANKPGASEYGAEINHTLADSKTNVSFVGMWYLDQASNMGGTSNTFFKAKMSQDAHLAASLTHKFNESFTATFGAQVRESGFCHILGLRIFHQDRQLPVYESPSHFSMHMTMSLVTCADHFFVTSVLSSTICSFV